MNKRTKRNLQVAGGVAALMLLAVGIASAKDPKPSEDDGCGDGMMPNPLIAELTAQLASAPANQRQRLEARIARLSRCVVSVCPDGYHRDKATAECVKDTPEDPPTFDPWDPGSEKKCPDGKRWSPAKSECVPDCPPGEFYYAPADKCLPKPDGPTPGGDIDDILKPVPVPGNFYQVKAGDLFFGQKLSSGNSPLSICYMALRRAAFEAAKLYGQMSDQAAWAHVNANAGLLKHELKSLRPYLDIISCSWWIDELYSSWRYTAGKSTPGPTGRAVSINNPAHAPNLDRLRAGEAPARNVRLGKPADKGKGPPTIADGDWRSYPLLWIPEIDLEKFWQSGFNTITAEGVVWPDGSSRAVPPPWVQALEIVDATGTLQQGTMMGCGPSARVFG